MSLNTFKNGSPEFIFEDYFLGETVAHGIFEDRSGTVVSQFKIDIVGTLEDDILTLDEDFYYANGDTEVRQWKLKILPDGKYEGTADGVVGIATGERAGNAFNWRYEFDLQVDDKTYRLKFNDWMFLQEGGVLLNRAFVTKWGFNVGSVTLSFYKPEQEAMMLKAAE